MNSIAEFRQSSLLITFNSSGLDRSTDPWPLHFLFSVSTTQFIIIKKVIYICNICIHELIFIVAPSSFYAPESPFIGFGNTAVSAHPGQMIPPSVLFPSLVSHTCVRWLVIFLYCLKRGVTHLSGNNIMHYNHSYLKTTGHLYRSYCHKLDGTRTVVLDETFNISLLLPFFAYTFVSCLPHSLKIP